MPGMREKIARALVEADGENPDAYHPKAAYEGGHALPDHAIPLWRQAETSRRVRAVLNALREPDEGMLRAVDGEDEDKHVARGRAYSAWTAMIDSVRTPPEGA